MRFLHQFLKLNKLCSRKLNVVLQKQNNLKKSEAFSDNSATFNHHRRKKPKMVSREIETVKKVEMNTVHIKPLDDPPIKKVQVPKIPINSQIYKFQPVLTSMNDDAKHLAFIPRLKYKHLEKLEPAPKKEQMVIRTELIKEENKPDYSNQDIINESEFLFIKYFIIVEKIIVNKEEPK